MAGEVAAGQHLAHLHGGLAAAAGHQVLVGGRAGAVAQVQVHQTRPHPAGHVERIGARGRGVRQVERVMGVVTVQRVVGRRERRDGGAGTPPALAHPLDRRLARAEESVGAKREHVLHRDEHVAAGLEFGDLLAEPVGVAALPAERRMHHHGLGAEPFGGLHAAGQLGDRVGTPYPLGDQQTRRMHGQHRHVVPARKLGDRTDVLADRLGPHHQLDPVVAELGGVFEGRLGPQRIDRGRRQTDLDGWAH